MGSASLLPDDFPRIIQKMKEGVLIPCLDIVQVNKLDTRVHLRRINCPQAASFDDDMDFCWAFLFFRHSHILLSTSEMK